MTKDENKMLRISQDCVIFDKLILVRNTILANYLDIPKVLSYIIYYLKKQILVRITFDVCVAPFTQLYKILVLLNTIYGNIRLLFSLQD